jgi:hypothetical protein
LKNAKSLKQLRSPPCKSRSTQERVNRPNNVTPHDSSRRKKMHPVAATGTRIISRAAAGAIVPSLSNRQTCEQTPDQAGRAYIQPSCQERKHPPGPMQELGAFACGPPVELLPTHNRCRLSEKAVTGVTLFSFWRSVIVLRRLVETSLCGGHGTCASPKR